MTTPRRPATQVVTSADVEKLQTSVGELIDSVQDLAHNESWRRQLLEKVVSQGRRQRWMNIFVLVAAVLAFTAGRTAASGVSVLKSFTDPKSCLVIFSRYSTATQTWQRQRDNALLHPDVAAVVYPPDGVPPRPPLYHELQPGARCAATYARYKDRLP